MNRSLACLTLTALLLIAALAVGNPFLRSRHAAPAAALGLGDGHALPVTPTGLAAPAFESARVPAVTGSGEPAALADPDGVGPCPPSSSAIASPVVRRGLDPMDGLPTWWHADGRVTKRQRGYRVRGADGRESTVPATIVLPARPRAARDHRD